jgi:deoxyribodipyrimidine photo-lyase
MVDEECSAGRNLRWGVNTVQPARVKVLVECAPRAGGAYVLYWMQQAQRTRFNHALEYSIGRANELGLPVVVCFGLMDDYPEANARHYLFMLQGLADVRANLERRGIRFVVKRGGPGEVAVHYARGAALVVADRGYLRHQKAWRAEVAEACARMGVGVAQVESDVVVPVEVASNKREYAARTIRPKIQRRLGEFLVGVKGRKVAKSALGLRVRGDVEVSDPARALAGLRVDRSVSTVERFFVGGEEAGRRRLTRFVRERLKGYDEGRNEPSADRTSHLSAYLHFGQVSAIELALAVRDARTGRGADGEAFLEELIVRRELAANFCEFTENYDAYDALPGWAKQTLREHERDARPAVYSDEELEQGRTADEYWNAAQREMVCTGFMHNYMRMYWGKRILEWSRTAREGYERTLRLNNKWFLCGRDVNAYANVGWIYGLHDRPWGPAREVFGTVRYMNAAGLRRKFDVAAYVERVKGLSESCL